MAGESTASIARKNGFVHSSICRAFHRFGLPVRNRKEARAIARLLGESEIRRLHRVYATGVPIEELPQICLITIGDDAIRKAFHRLKLKIRNKKEAVKIGWARQTPMERERVSEIHRNIFKHGHNRKGRRTTEYRIWAGILTRCNNPKNHTWKYYGARGIRVCKRWLKFENFLADMGRRPEGKSINRINNDGDYKPSNCEWATLDEQMKNRRKYSKR